MTPICQYPTTIVIIDDDQSFLNNISLHLPHKHASFKYHSRPLEGLKSIKEGLRLLTLNQRLFHSSDISDNLIHQTSVNYNQLACEIYNDDRFKEISTIVVDYNMPGINGIKLLKELDNENIQKILLTGEADEQLAIQAFSDGIINDYIKKQDPNLEQLLYQRILEAQKRYFEKLTTQLRENVASDPNFPTAINNPQFEEFFLSIIDDLNIVEFYQFEKVGSYLLVDANGTEYCLYTQNEDQFNAYHLEIKDMAGNDPILSSIKNRDKMICLPIAQADLINKPDQWSSYLNSTHKVIKANNNNLYCSIKEASSGLDLSDIQPFAAYSVSKQF